METVGKVVALLTDFGVRDYFVAEMKAVILSISPDAVLVDITHDVPPQDVASGAFVLWRAYKWFPKGTIFIGVVDPGVGTERAPIIIKTKNYIFLGPDNGLLSLASEEDGVDEVYEITVRLAQTSYTFHGRDIFAYAAALILKGVELKYIGAPRGSFVKLEKPGAELVEGGARVKVIYIDRFGNIFTSLTRDIALKLFNYNNILCIKYKNNIIRVPLAPSYGYVGRGEILALINSEGFLEIAENRGNASARLELNVGDELEIRKC
ncbi:MAG: S-adenosyl-l-methionine hydroxide adenosyltransferase family protein [Thermoproteus sp.]|nr:S-adenosyl-l-methionine hydroxide adenosyltransferase family protein [Thermoproteus sp.]